MTGEEDKMRVKVESGITEGFALVGRSLFTGDPWACLREFLSPVNRLLQKGIGYSRSFTGFAGKSIWMMALMTMQSAQPMTLYHR